MTSSARPSPSRLILGSSSVYRRELLERLTRDFDVISPDIDESPLVGEGPEALALRLAVDKCAAVAAVHPDALVIASDQVAANGSTLLGKPGNKERAAEQLAASSGRQVSFYTGVCLRHDAAGFVATHVDITTVRFRELSAAEIDAYLERDKPWNCAGSFRSEGLGVTLFEAIETQDPAALIGLPLIWLASAMRDAGMDVLATSTARPSAGLSD